jgi:hypothetical protein
MILNTLCLISLPEIGLIVYIAILLFGLKAVSQNPTLSRGQKGIWILTIIILNWIGLLWYYYVYYIKDR